MANQSAARPNQRSPRQNQNEGGLRDGSGMVSRGVRQMDGMVEDHEVQSVLIALAAGFGVGCLIGCALASDSSHSSRMTERFAAEGLGRRMMESLEKMLPDAISSQLRG